MQINHQTQIQNDEFHRSRICQRDDYLPNTMWVKNFLEAQGHKVVESIFEQDNGSAIKLEKNGRMSAGPKSQQIIIRYFWMKDRVKSEDIMIRHCPTLQMLGISSQNPFKGACFRKSGMLLWETNIWILSLSTGLCRSRSVLESFDNLTTAPAKARVITAVTVHQ
jgi:hypothetical protein